MSFQNELAILEFIHNLVETFDAYFEKVVSKFVWFRNLTALCHCHSVSQVLYINVLDVIYQPTGYMASVGKRIVF